MIKDCHISQWSNSCNIRTGIDTQTNTFRSMNVNFGNLIIVINRKKKRDWDWDYLVFFFSFYFWLTFWSLWASHKVNNPFGVILKHLFCWSTVPRSLIFPFFLSLETCWGFRMISISPQLFPFFKFVGNFQYARVSSRDPVFCVCVCVSLLLSLKRRRRRTNEKGRKVGNAKEGNGMEWNGMKRKRKRKRKGKGKIPEIKWLSSIQVQENIQSEWCYYHVGDWMRVFVLVSSLIPFFSFGLSFWRRRMNWKWNERNLKRKEKKRKEKKRKNETNLQNGEWLKFGKRINSNMWRIKTSSCHQSHWWIRNNTMNSTRNWFFCWILLSSQHWNRNCFHCFRVQQ